MTKFIIKTIAAMACVATLSAGGAANAGGLGGDLIEGLCGNCGLGRQLDDVHKNLGNPMDEVAAPVVQKFVPSSPHCSTPAGLFITNWGLVNTPCQANGWLGVYVQ